MDIDICVNTLIIYVHTNLLIMIETHGWPLGCGTHRPDSARADKRRDREGAGQCIEIESSPVLGHEFTQQAAWNDEPEERWTEGDSERDSET